jgi:putative ABC transport system ATP-binding protein
MSAPVIRFDGLSYAYGAGSLRRQVLFGLSGEVRAGEIVIVKGPSGSGKTTLLSLVGGLRAVQDGRLVVLGERLDGASRSRRRRVRSRIGYVFQLHNLIGALTATQNLLMALRLHPEIERPVAAAREALVAVGLGHAFDMRPPELSGGERQRVAVARALVTRPRIVLADEPTASLDGKTGQGVVARLRGLASEQGSAVLLVTHDARMADAGDRIVDLEDGRFVEGSDPER